MVDTPPLQKPEKDDKETKDKVSWTPAQEATLVAVLLEQMKQGNQAESGWKSVIWTAVVSALEKEQSGIPKKTNHCKSRWQRLKGEYKQVKELREQSRFGWDATRQIVTAEPEVWQSFIQAHPKLAKWRMKSFPLYDDIATIVGDVIATGQHVFRAKSTKPNSPDTSDNEEDNNDSLEDISAKTPKKRASSAVEVQSSCKRPTRATGVDAIMSVSGAVESLAAALLAPEPSTSQLQLAPSPVRRGKAFQIAEEEEGLSGDEMAAVGILFEKSTPAADMYMSIRNKKTHQIWLRKRLEN